MSQLHSGVHLYRHIWFAAIGEVLYCERESTNLHGRYAVAVKKRCNNNLAFTSKGIACLFAVPEMEWYHLLYIELWRANILS